ncbi:MAG: sulfite exporter TauE/SafE family protein [Alphaproteobacteria bacterium]
MDLVPLIIAMLTAGLAAGFLAGLLGVGGGIVVVPALFFALGFLGVDEAIRMQIAVGSSLATIVCTGFISAKSHYAKNNVNTDALKGWLLPIGLGVALGSVVASYLNSTDLALIFGVVAFLVACWLTFAKVAESDEGLKRPSLSVWYSSGGFVGFISALMGIGGGTISVPLLTWMGEKVHRAVGTSAAIGVAIGLIGTLGFIITGWRVQGLPMGSVGFVNLIAVAAIIPTSMLMAPVGARVVTLLAPKTVRIMFACFLLLVSFNMIRRGLGF